jgi:hypothetical protein
MSLLERFRKSPDETLKIPPTGNLCQLLQVVQQQFPDRSKAIDHLAVLIVSRSDLALTYTHLPTVQTFLRYVRDKRAFLDADGRFVNLSSGNLPDFLQRYLQEINAGCLLPEDVKAKVDQAFFIVIHPKVRDRRWVSVAHHNFTEYRGNMYGPGWAEPVYGLFSDKPKGFEISFSVATGYDDPALLRRLFPVGGGSRRVSSLVIDDSEMSFSIGDSPGAYHKVCVPVKVAQWRGYDIVDGQWQKGWQVFGVTGGVHLKEIMAPS